MATHLYPSCRQPCFYPGYYCLLYYYTISIGFFTMLEPDAIFIDDAALTKNP